MKKRSVMVVVFILLITVKFACGATEYKLAFVDLQKALNLCKAGQDAKEKFGKEVEQAEEKTGVGKAEATAAAVIRTGRHSAPVR